MDDAGLLDLVERRTDLLGGGGRRHRQEYDDPNRARRFHSARSSPGRTTTRMCEPAEIRREPKGKCAAPNGLRLQAPQEVQQVLLVRRGQRSIALDDAVRLGGGKAPILATRVSFDRFDQVAGAAIVQE